MVFVTMKGEKAWSFRGAVHPYLQRLMRAWVGRAMKMQEFKGYYLAISQVIAEFY
jgi:hypothetical protein